MNRFEDFANSKEGRTTVVIAIIVAGIFIIYSITSLFGGNETAQLSRKRMFICSETGKAFEFDLEAGMKVPVVSPYSRKNTGYMAEACYWTKDGKIKNEPSWVLLNEAVHKPGPTFCPDCGRLVVGHNPYPQPGNAPPPAEAEYTAEAAQR